MTRTADDDAQLIAYCPGCREPSPCALHDDRIRQRKRISIRPISPVCRRCGSQVVVDAAAARGRGRKLIVLTGTCGSGKSTTAEMLIARHGFHGIDGNGVQDVLRSRRGSPAAFDGPEVLEEIASEVDILLSLDRDIVLSHVILPDDLPRYRALFQARGLRHLVVVLVPPYATALQRCRARTSFSSVVSEDWVRRFHEAASRFEPAEDLIVLDNSAGGAEESVRVIIDRLRR